MGTIEATTIGDCAIEIALKSEGVYVDYSVESSIVQSALQIADNMDMEDHLLERLPIKVELVVKGTDVLGMVSVNSPDELQRID